MLIHLNILNEIKVYSCGKTISVYFVVMKILYARGLSSKERYNKHLKDKVVTFVEMQHRKEF